MSTEPMTIRIQLFGSEENLLDTYDLRVKDESNVDGELSVAVSKLVLHTWTLAPGDCIRINEV